jgi:hypothetical protein
VSSLLPWRYPFLRDAPRHREVLRPIVSAQLIGADIGTPVKALVDSGSEHCLAAPWVAADAKADLRQATHALRLGMGGDNPEVSFLHVTLRLLDPNGGDDDFVEWETEVGFPDNWRAPWPMLLGQHGFFDHFTVSMHRTAALTVVEDSSVFERRFGTNATETEQRT